LRARSAQGRSDVRCLDRLFFFLSTSIQAFRLFCPTNTPYTSPPAMSNGPQGPGQRYFPNQQNSSSANLLSGRSPPSSSPLGPQATFSKAPSVRSYDSAALEESRYNIASTRGSISRPSSFQPSISEKVRTFRAPKSISLIRAVPPRPRSIGVGLGHLPCGGRRRPTRPETRPQ
jgi:hypothetical protein